MSEMKYTFGVITMLSASITLILASVPTQAEEKYVFAIGTELDCSELSDQQVKKLIADLKTGEEVLWMAYKCLGQYDLFVRIAPPLTDANREELFTKAEKLKVNGLVMYAEGTKMLVAARQKNSPFCNCH